MTTDAWGGAGGAGRLGTGDLVILALYFVVLVGVGLLAARRGKGEGGKKPPGGAGGAGAAGGEAPAPAGAGESYFLASRSASWWEVGASLFASNIGAEHFVGLAGTAAYSGIAVGFYEWGAVLCLMFLAYLFLPPYLSSAVSTMPDFLEKRYSRTCCDVLVVLSLVLYILTKISATLYAGQLIVSEVLHVNEFLAVLFLIVVTTVYTAVGGLLAVILTEILQTAVLLVGGFILMVISLEHVGGYGGLQRRLEGQVPASYFHVFRPNSDPDLPWLGLLTGYFIASTWYWACDQVIVQRTLAAKNVLHGQAGCMLASLLKLFPGFIMVLPGMAGRAMMLEAGVVDADSPKSAFDRVFTWVVMEKMPVNLKGLVIAAMLSALMSSLASIFNSCSTIVALDVYQRVRPGARERQIIWAGRVIVAVMAVLSVLWLPLIPLFGENLFLYIQKPVSYSAPPVLCLFLWGVLFEFVNTRGAVHCLGWGLGLGAARFALELVALGAPGLARAPVLDPFIRVNFLFFATLQFLAASAIILGVSWATRPRNADAREDRAVAMARFMWRPSLARRLMTAELGFKKLEDTAAEVEAGAGGGAEELREAGLREATGAAGAEAEEVGLIPAGGATSSRRAGAGAEAAAVLAVGSRRSYTFWRRVIDGAAVLVLVADVIILAVYG